jgi:adenylate kinase
MNSGDKNDRAAWLKHPSIRCSRSPEKLDRPWRLVLLGAPGVGKGTQAELLTLRLGACHLSTGDLFREAKQRSEREQTLAMGAALNFMRRGALVPDAIVWELIRERTSCLHCPGGFVLDGFPRTLAQAKALQVLLDNENLALDAAITYELPVAEIVSRLSGRRTCEKCKAIFHLTAQPSRIEGICDKCGGDLFQREDDRPESIAVRLDAYETSTAPLINFYRNLGLLTLVVATGSPEEIFQRTMTILESRAKRPVAGEHSEQSAVFAQ